ncbi:Sugar or nucleoside kinase, ribokinase family [Propionispira arboris]|uniref:Sugar or nucleoside kinase, ribokinase family n=1 Tax=Propionispira arboris TaxID=84035 RepID=A0A1H6XWP4_9FIRM|nr:PfkB family carbohydrate kinase [Propionispira arboris]SEJ29270.1 Sugar or nucleoside kinase, ribokinase family [Propionispira arboris]
MKNKKLVSNKKILILGSAVIDVIINIERLPKAGEDITGVQKGQNVGGCAYNVAKILKHLQIKHDLCVPVGNGPYADIIKSELYNRNQSILIEDTSADNGYSLSLVEADGERTFITVDGIETKWSSSWFENIDIQIYDYIYISGYGFQDANDSGDVILSFIRHKRMDCQLILDPGPRLIGKRFKDEVLKMNTILELNEQEAKALAENEDIFLAVEQLYAVTQNPIIVTMGSKGTLCYTSGKSELVPVQIVKAIDTIGAGDSHTAAFIAGIAAGYELRDACVLANDIASRVVQHVGCCVL